MKILQKILLLGLSVGCASNNRDSQTNEGKYLLEDSTELYAEIIDNKIVELNDTNLCNCVGKDYKRTFSTQVTFQKHFRKKNDSLFIFWSNDSSVKKLKSIRFEGFDTIPEKFKIFTEVERLSINTQKGIYGLDYFPKLKIVFFFGSIIDIKSDEEWTKKIEAIFAAKTKFSGLYSFESFKNLRVMEMWFSGFENFPNDIEKMRCLEKLILVSYSFGEIDLNTIDLSNNAYLKEIEFRTWFNTLKGLPQGLDNPNIESVEIRHQKLTQEEKERLNKQ